MAAVTELGNGMWFVNWFTDTLRSTQNVQCGQTLLQLHLNSVNDQVTLTLTAIQGTGYL